EPQPLANRDAAFQQERPDLIDNAGALTDQPFAHAVQRLQVELLGGLGRDELHGRTLHRLGNRLGVAEVILLPLRIRAHVLRRHQPCYAPKVLQLAAEMMCPCAGLHADEAPRQSRKPRFHLAARPLLPQHDRTALILADDVERVLADIDTDHVDLAVEYLGHGMLLCLRWPASLARWQGGSTAGPSHSETLAAEFAVVHKAASPRAVW